MSRRMSALLLTLAVAACHDVTTQITQSPPKLAWLRIDNLSKVVLPGNASVELEVTWGQASAGVLPCPRWTTSDSEVVSLSRELGIGQGTCGTTWLSTRAAGTAVIKVALADKEDSAIVTVVPFLHFASVGSNCGLTVSGSAYCWGPNDIGQLGIDMTTDDCDNCNSIPRPVAGGLTFSALATMWGTGPLGSASCAVTATGALYCWGKGYANTPSELIGAPVFASLTGGGEHMCGLTSDGSAYCWGDNTYGQLGDGTQLTRDEPVRVAGGLRFSSISAGGLHTCAIASDGATYCWGRNVDGELGDADTVSSPLPTRVAGDFAFLALSSDGARTCGLGAAGAAYCWGAVDSTAVATVPEPVAGGHSFASLDVFGSMCGISGDGTAYCWGWEPTAAGGCPRCWVPTWRWVYPPEPLAGSARYLAQGGRHHCWMGLDGAAYCWDGFHGTAPARLPGQQP